MRAVERASGISTLAKIRKDVSVEKDRRGADGDRSGLLSPAVNRLEKLVYVLIRRYSSGQN